MRMTSNFLGQHPEPPAWLYDLVARGALARRIYKRTVADLAASLPSGALLLDVGTGPGYLLRYLAQERPDVHLLGLDLDFQMIRRARRGKPALASLEWVVGDAQALPFADGTFHHIVATLSYHIWPEPLAGLDELWRSLRPGGRAWIYEMKRETTAVELRLFAQEERLPFLAVYLGFKVISPGHSLLAEDFATDLKQAGKSGWRLSQAHHLFWKGELYR